MRGTSHDLATLAVSLLGSLVMPTVIVASLASPSPDSIGYRSPFPANWIVPPEPPPPRA